MNTQNLTRVICPYCFKEFDDYMEAYDLIEEGTSSWDDEEVSGTGEIYCSHCDKKFRVDVDTQITFSTHKI